MRFANHLLLLGVVLTFLPTATISAVSDTETPQPDEFTAGCIAELERGGQGVDLPGGLTSVFTLDVSAFLRQEGPVQAASSITTAIHNRVLGTTDQRVKRQARELGRFLKGLILNLDGLPQSLLPFDRVEIVSRNLFGPWRAMELDGRTLVIRMGIATLTADQMRAKWAAGKQYPWQSLDRSLWKYSNPTGNLLSGIRSKLKAGAVLAQEAVRLLKKRAEAAQAGDGNPDLVRSDVVKFLVAGAGRTLSPDVTDTFQKASLPELIEMLGRLENHIGNPETIHSLMTRTRFTGGRVRTRMYFSFIGYGNLHWIRVAVGYGPGAEEQVLCSNVGPDTEFTMVCSVALIGYTMDVIDVQAFFDRLHIAEGIRAALSK